MEIGKENLLFELEMLSICGPMLLKQKILVYFITTVQHAAQFIFFGGNLFVMANQLNCFQSCQISPPFYSQNPHKIISVLYENSQLHILLQIAQLKTFEEIWR